MRKLGMLVGLAVGLVAFPEPADAQRGEPTTATRTDLVLYDITCDLKIFAKAPDGTEKQIPNNGSWLWSTLTPPRVYAMVFVRNSGRLGVSVKSTLFLNKPIDPTAPWMDGPEYFVNASGTKSAERFYPVVTVPANSLAALGPYWLKNESGTIQYSVVAHADSDQQVRETIESNNYCSSRLTIIAPAR